MHIALCGFYGKSNFGDDLMADVLSQVICSNGKHTVQIFSDTTENDIINGANNNAHLLSDIIVFGGGGIVTPNFWAFKNEALDNIVKSGKPCCFVNVNVTEEFFSDPQFSTKIQLLNAKWWVRDINSIEILKRANIQANYLPDVCTRRNFLPPQKNENGKKLTVFLNDYIFHNLNSDNTFEFLRTHQNIKILASYFDWMHKFGWQVTFYPSQTSWHIDDRICSAVAYSNMQTRKDSKWITNKVEWREIVSAIQGSNLVVSMRYHPTLISLISGIPTVDVTHHSKNKNFILDNKLNELSVNYYELTKDKLIQATQFAEKLSYKQNINDFYNNANMLWEQFDQEWIQYCNSILQQKGE